jgi:hypothetical protein
MTRFILSIKPRPISLTSSLLVALKRPLLNRRKRTRERGEPYRILVYIVILELLSPLKSR